MISEPLQVTLLVTSFLEKMNIPYLIGGSLASTLHGMVRMTQDSDLVVMLRDEHISAFEEALKGDFFIEKK